MLNKASLQLENSIFPDDLRHRFCISVGVLEEPAEKSVPVTHLYSAAMKLFLSGKSCAYIPSFTVPLPKDKLFI